MEIAEKVGHSLPCLRLLTTDCYRWQGEAPKSTKEAKARIRRRRRGVQRKAKGRYGTVAKLQLFHKLTRPSLDAKANKEMAEKAKGKGPMNAGQQGIKKSGKK